jgi:hypothetical protein
LDNPNLSAQDFAGQLQSYLTTYQEFFDQSLNQTIILTQKGLPEISQLPEGRIQSQYDGSQPKVELYEVFKALNDKWIAGSNFKESSLFEDIMFLDRASRDIGQKILIDIFDLERITDSDSINYNMSVFVFLAGILTKNHFSVMPLPAYVNFYNQTQDVAPLKYDVNLNGEFFEEPLYLLNEKLKQKQQELQEAKTTLYTMQSSPIWRLRTAWFKLKYLFFPILGLLSGLTLVFLVNSRYTYPLVATITSWYYEVNNNFFFVLGGNLVSLALIFGIVGYLGFISANILRVLRIALILGGLLAIAFHLIS